MAKSDAYDKYRAEKKATVKIDVKMDKSVGEAFNALCAMKGEDAIDIGLFLEDALKRAGVVKMATDLTSFGKKGETVA